MLTPGTRVGPYEILGSLGAGGMGEVYKAKDTRLDRTVAIKVLPDHVAGDPTLKQRFELEAKAVSSLNHPHICTLHDVGHQDPASAADQAIDFLVLEYLDGETLAQRLEQSGRLPIAQALAIAIQIAGALDQAHRAGIVHRDLKPANVFLVRKGGTTPGEPFAKLLDFGLAKSTAPVVTGSALSMLPTTPAGVTVQGAILGTFQYMAPEQIEGIEADVRTDIFALGLVLFEMLTGRTAFEGKTRASLLGAILKDVPPAVSQLRPDSPGALDRIVATCLAKEPDDRWQTARDLMRELQWLADSPDEQPTRSAATPSSASRRYLPWVAAIATLAAVALAIAATRDWRASGEDSPLMRLEMSTPPTTDSLSFALSPDGTKIVFIATSDGRPRLWLRALDSSTARPLERTDGAASPFWSPDGRSVAFFADRSLKRIDIDAGSVQTLSRANGAAGGTWGSDDTIVFSLGAASGLSKVSSLGGAVSSVTQLEKDHQGHRNPQLLPDGRHLVFHVRGDDDVRGVYVTSLDGLTPRRLLDGDTSPPVYVIDRKIFFVRQSTLFEQDFDPDRLTLSGAPHPIAEQVGVNVNQLAALSLSRDGLIAYRTAAADNRRQFVWVDRSGHALQTVGAPDVNRVWSPQLSPDGQQVAMHRGTAGNVDIYVLDVRRGLLTRVTSDPANELQPVWSPDGTRFAFAAFHDGVFQLRLRTLATRQEESLQIDGFPVDWSSNGNVLLYAGNADPRDNSGAIAGNSRLWAMAVDERKPILVTEGSRRGQFSPDGKWVAFESAESGEMDVYVQAFPKSEGKIRVSANGGAQPRWSPDGSELFYIALDERLMSVPMRKLTNGTLEPSTPTPLFMTHVGGGVQELTSALYMVARDGRFLMNTLLEEERAEPIRLILNRKRN
jgi:serine/threonine protein kinase